MARTSSLREGAEIARWAESVISVEGLAKMHPIEPPVSLRELLEFLAPEQVIWETGEMKAGDVSGSLRLILLSNGYWNLRGKLSDSGIVFGDNYSFGYATRFVDPDGHVLGFGYSGHLDAKEDIGIDEAGWDQRIRNHFAEIGGAGADWTLQVDSDIAVEDLWDELLAILIPVGVIVAWIMSDGETNCEQNENGEFSCRKKLN